MNIVSQWTILIRRLGFAVLQNKLRSGTVFQMHCAGSRCVVNNFRRMIISSFMKSPRPSG